MNKKIEKILKAAKGVYPHGGYLRIHFRLPGNRSYTKKALGLPITESNINLASNRLAAIKLDIASGLYDNDSKVFWRKHFPTDVAHTTTRATVNDYLDFYTELRSDDLSLSSISKFAYARSWFKRNAILNRDVRNIDHRELELLRKRSLITLKYSTVSEYMRTLRVLLDEAVKDDRIPYNPFTKLSRIKIDKDPSEEDDVSPFSQDELSRLLAVVHIPQTRRMIQLLAWSGMRPGEMKALAWEDVDLDKGIAHVRYNINRAGQLKPPKTQAGIRKIELMPLALSALKEQRAQTYMMPAIEETLHLKHGRKKTVTRRRVFLGRNNKPYKRPELTTVIGSWADWLRQAKLIHREPYQLRHTFASQMLTAKADPAWLAKQMGHKDWGMIRKIYASWVDSERPDHRLEIAKNLVKNVPHVSHEASQKS